MSADDHPTQTATRRILAMEAAALALYPIMDREGMADLHAISAGELAAAAVEAFERVMGNAE